MRIRRLVSAGAAVALLLAPHTVGTARAGGRVKPAPTPAGTLDLAVSLSDTPDPVTTGSEFSYDAVVTNVGTLVAPDVQVRVPVRHSYTTGTAVYGSVTSSRGSCSFETFGPGSEVPLHPASDLWLVRYERGSVPVCAVGTLAPGERATMRVVVRPAWAARENAYGISPMTGGASHSYASRDSDATNDSDEEDTTVTAGSTVADCVLTRGNLLGPVDHCTT